MQIRPSSSSRDGVETLTFWIAPMWSFFGDKNSRAAFTFGDKLGVGLGVDTLTFYMELDFAPPRFLVFSVTKFSRAAFMFGDNLGSH